MNIATNIASSQNSIGFLPELCTPQAVLRIMVVAQVLALVLAFTSASSSYQASLIRLGLTSIFVQWVVLCSTVTVCLLSDKIGKLNVVKITAAVSAIVIVFTMGASVLAIMADSYQKVGLIHYWDTPFILRNVFIALILTTMALHYFYVHSQREEFSRADSGAKYDALQSRMKPHFLFNSLNSIAQLIQVDKNKAEDALLDLADIFRTTLDTRNRISFAESQSFHT